MASGSTANMGPPRLPDRVRTLEINRMEKEMFEEPNFHLLTSDQSPAYFDNTVIIERLLDIKSRIIMQCMPPGSGKSVTALSLVSYLRNPTYYSEPATNKTEAPEVFQARTFLINGSSYAPPWRQQRPVIRLDMGFVKGATLQKFNDSLRSAVAKAFKEHEYLLEKLQPDDEREKADRKKFLHLLNEESSEAELESAISLLAYLIRKYTGHEPFLVMDDADHPMNSVLSPGVEEGGLIHDFYDSFIKQTLAVTVPLEKAFLFGVVPFITTHGMKVYTLFNNPLADYFNVSGDQVDQLSQLLAEGLKLPTEVGNEMKKQLGGIRSFKAAQRVEKIALRPLIRAINELQEGASEAKMVRMVKRLGEARGPSIPLFLDNILYQPSYLAVILGLISAFRAVAGEEEEEEEEMGLPRVSMNPFNALNFSTLAANATQLGHYTTKLHDRSIGKLLGAVPDHLGQYLLLSTYCGRLVPVEILDGEATVQIPNEYTCRLFEEKARESLNWANADACNEFAETFYSLYELPTKAEVEQKIEQELRAQRDELDELEEAIKALRGVERKQKMTEFAEKQQSLKKRRMELEEGERKKGQDAADKCIQAFGNWMLETNRVGMLRLPDITEPTVSASIWAIAKHKHDRDGSGVEFKALKWDHKKRQIAAGRTDVIFKEGEMKRGAILELYFEEGKGKKALEMSDYTAHWQRTLTYDSIIFKRHPEVEDVTRVMFTMKKDASNSNERLQWAEILVVRAGVKEKFSDGHYIHDAETAEREENHYVFRATWNREDPRTVQSTPASRSVSRGEEVDEGDSPADECSHCPAKCTIHKCPQKPGYKPRTCKKCKVPGHLRTQVQVTANEDEEDSSDKVAPARPLPARPPTAPPPTAQTQLLQRNCNGNCPAHCGCGSSRRHLPCNHRCPRHCGGSQSSGGATEQFKTSPAKKRRRPT